MTTRATRNAHVGRWVGVGAGFGTAAAVANAVHHATGVRIRDLPIRLDQLIGAM